MSQNQLPERHYNLLHERWIPVRRRSGVSCLIAPYEVTSLLADDPVVSVDAPRPDFTGALTEFLIGLLATARLANDDDEWDVLWDTPPDPQDLAQSFAPYMDAFWLDGPGARIFQDIDPLQGASTVPVSSLLIDAPGANTVRLNRDVFVKRDQVGALGPEAAAMALITLQLYAPSGGAGHRTGLRGGGPLTTLAIPDERRDPSKDTLWHRLWLNTETGEDLVSRQVEAGRDNRQDIFPWLAASRTSQKQGGVLTTPADAHPLQAYWPMPRRIRLLIEPSAGGAPCDLTGIAADFHVRGYQTRPWGINYENWQHPLSPHRRDKPANPHWLPVHGQPGGLSYRHYLGLVFKDSDTTEGATKKPASALVAARGRLSPDVPRLLAFGYDMDNMKARGWVQSEMPLPQWIDDPETDRRVSGLVHRFIDAARVIGRSAVWAVKSALFENPADAGGDFSWMGDEFWRQSEDEFIDLTFVQAPARYQAGDDSNELEDRWLAVLKRTAFDVFDGHVDTLTIEGGNMKRMVNARYFLTMATGGHNKRGRELFKVLGLPLPKTAKANKKSAKTETA